MDNVLRAYLGSLMDNMAQAKAERDDAAAQWRKHVEASPLPRGNRMIRSA